MEWTERQAEAIELRNKNMLVAAAAGSGKTAVLVERIKQLIINENVGVNEMLVVTFTNAAASEMREKIVKAITNEIEKSPAGDTAFLRKQLNNIYKANISTFHAFALEVIRRFFHLINIDPNFKICDEAQQIILKAEAMTNLFEEMFESSDEGFITFLNNYASGKNEDSVKEMILEVYKTIQSVTNPWEWLNESVEALKLTEEEFKKSKVFAEIKLYIIDELRCALNSYEKSIEIFEEAGATKFALKCKPDLTNMEEAINTFLEDDFDATAQILDNISYTRMVATKDEKEYFDEVKGLASIYRDKCKDIIKGVKDDYFLKPLSEQILDMNSIYKYALTLKALVEKFNEHYVEAKREKRIIDFNDIEHYALRILNIPQAAKEYRDKFKYIFIDEYQDSNIIQDTLIGYIRRENNLFMVGDVKQSIYKFRLAEPELFVEKYDRFKQKENILDTKIDLNFNFRSKGNVIKAVNDVFCQLMKGYDEDAALYKGIKYEGELDYNTELHIVDQKISDEMELDEDIKELKTAEKEAFIAGKIIRDSIGKTIFDAKQNIQRPMVKRDIVILMRGQKNYADKFQQVLLEMDIPTHISDSDGYFDTLEIQIFLNLLRIIDNRRQDIPFLSVLHSSIFNFTVAELAEIRAYNKHLSYFDAFCEFAKGDAKCAEVLRMIEEWQKLSKFMPLDEFIWKLLLDTGYYTFVAALPGGTQRQANIRALVDKAVQFQTSQMKGLYGFITYIDAMKDKKVPMGQVTLVGENDDVVRIMTIHKSKGLEFPMVIVAGMGKRFNNANSRIPIDLHKNIGLAFKYANRNQHYYEKILLQKFIDKKRRQEDMEEEVRILYVAFTRAQDKLVLLGSVRDLQKFKESKEVLEEADIFRSGSYLEMIMPVIAKSDITIHCHDSEEIYFDNKASVIEEDNIKKLFKANNYGDSEQSNGNQTEYGKLYAQIHKQLSFKYGYDYAKVLKSKFSVSKINTISKMIHDEKMTPEIYERLYYETSYDRSLAVPSFAEQKKSGFSAAERGTIIHSVLEHWNFKEGITICKKDKKSAISYVYDLVDKLIMKKLLTEEEGVVAKKSANLIIDFQLSEIGQRLSLADEINREIPFNLIREVKGENVIVQGIIDCYFREGDRIVLLDYKTNWINNINDKDEIEYIKEMYRNQIEMYKESIETVYGVSVSEAYIYLLNAGVAIAYDNKGI
ncbi:MAG: helicase-exonuclease AddAB subunit AddA [Aminipila sp.]